MKVPKVSLSAVVLLVILLNTVPGWADKIPVRRPSDYGVTGTQEKLDTPSFTQISQDGMTIDLDSVFCNGCDPTDPNSTFAMTYFFAISLGADTQLDSLTFGPGFDTNSFAFGPVQFDSALDSSDNQFCASGGTYTCSVPISASTLDFSAVDSTFTCDISGVCTLSFTGFNTATIGSGTIIFAASTPFSGSILNDPSTRQPLTPDVSATTSQVVVSVLEPEGVWLAVMASLMCLGAIGWRRREASKQFLL